MENSICTPQKKEGFRTASKVALKKKGALFGHTSLNLLSARCVLLLALSFLAVANPGEFVLSYGSFVSAAQRSHCMFRQWDRVDS